MFCSTVGSEVLSLVGGCSHLGYGGLACCWVRDLLRVGALCCTARPVGEGDQRFRVADTDELMLKSLSLLLGDAMAVGYICTWLRGLVCFRGEAERCSVIMSAK